MTMLYRGYLCFISKSLPWIIGFKRIDKNHVKCLTHCLTYIRTQLIVTIISISDFRMPSPTPGEMKEHFQFPVPKNLAILFDREGGCRGAVYGHHRFSEANGPHARMRS